MLILLPPSEGKTAPRRGRPLDLSRLSSPELTAARTQVLDALVAVANGPDPAGALGISAGLTAEVARDAHLLTIPTAAAERVYSGVLYDALGVDSLDAAGLRRARRRILIISAAFGAVRLADRIPAYRLSMAVNLPGVGPLAGHWRGPLAQALGDSARGCLVDCRSSTYAAAWRPPPALADRWVQVAVPGATHMAKHTRGLVARQLVCRPEDPGRPAGLATLLADRFDTALHAPDRAGRPWVLEVAARG